MRKVTRKPETTDPDLERQTLLFRAREFLAQKRMLKDIERQIDETGHKKWLAAYVDLHGEPDSQGHVWLDLPESIDGKRALKREKRTSKSMDQKEAARVLKERGVYDRYVRWEPVIDEDSIMSAYYDKILSEEDIDAITTERTIYALVPVE